MIGGMAFVEALLHGWDLARASGQEVVYDDEVVAGALGVMEQIGEMGRQQGAFGTLVDLPADADRPSTGCWPRPVAIRTGRLLRRRVAPWEACAP